MMEIRSAIARAYGWDDYQPRVYSPIQDQPEIATKVQQLVSNLIQGQLDTANTTTDFQNKLTDDDNAYLQAYQGMLGYLEGQPTITLIRRSSSAASTIYEYHAVFGRAVAVLHATVTQGNLIDGLQLDGIYLTRNAG
jgi:hypothetical protein